MCSMKGMTYDKSGTQVFVNHDNTHNIAATDKSDNLNKSTSTVKNMMRIVYLKKKRNKTQNTEEEGDEDNQEKNAFYSKDVY